MLSAGARGNVADRDMQQRLEDHDQDRAILQASGKIEAPPFNVSSGTSRPTARNLQEPDVLTMCNNVMPLGRDPEPSRRALILLRF